MKIIYGLTNGIVLQRGNDSRVNSYIELQGEGAVSIKLYGPPILAKTVTIEELEGNGERRRFRLGGIPAGGPYTVELFVGNESEIFSDVYVGDVWLLAGQSNMQGLGANYKVAGNYTNPCIRYYNFQNEYNVAHPSTLHLVQRSPNEDFKTWQGRPELESPNFKTTGPGYFFAEEMYRRTAVPQGLIPCAIGGSPLFNWQKEQLEGVPNFYVYALERFRECGANVRGIFWYQGCSDAMENVAEHFTDNMIELVNNFRRDFSSPDLPFVQVQIFSCTHDDPIFNKHWASVREQQRTLCEKIHNLDTVATTDAELDDSIHLSGDYQMKVGKNAAESMYHLCFDPMGARSTLAPQLDRVYMLPYSLDGCPTVAIKFKNLNGRLTSLGRPAGFAISTDRDSIPNQKFARVELHNDTAYLYCYAMEPWELKNYYLSYMLSNTVYANVTDEDGRPIPAFGPIYLGDIFQ